MSRSVMPTNCARVRSTSTLKAVDLRSSSGSSAGTTGRSLTTVSPRPPWIEICAIDHGSKGVIDFPMIQDRAALLWVINLGCIDLNQWYATCDDIDRPDYVHFDLDPGAGAGFERVLDQVQAACAGLLGQIRAGELS